MASLTKQKKNVQKAKVRAEGKNRKRAIRAALRKQVAAKIDVL